MKRKLSSLIAAVFIGIGAFSCICQAAGMDIDKEDGEYSIQVDLEGGSGKASVTSPTILTVKDGQAYAQIQWSSSNYDYMIVDGEKYLPTNEEGMNSVFEIPVLSMDEGMLDPGGTFGTLLLMGVMMLAIASILMAIGLQGKTVFAPLEQLRRAMEQYSTGDLDVRLPERENVSQIGQLYQTFNHMADQIQILRIDVYEKELERQRARSRFLQVQIQPHFYTNILNLIHGMAQIQDFEEIQKLCRVSAAYFRYLMGQKGTFVPLKEELRCLISYVEIQHCRYKDMLEIQVNVEPEMEDEMILPLVIQTFVGNSVKHNIMLVPHLEIELTVKREGEHDLLILIEDNG